MDVGFDAYHSLLGRACNIRFRIENARKQMLEKWEDIEFSEMMGQRSKERWEDPGCRERMIGGQITTKNSLEFHAKMRPLWDNPEYRLLKSEIAKQVWQDDPTIRERVSKAGIERWQEPEHREMMLEIRKEQGSRPEFIETIRQIAIKRWNIPENRERLSEIMLAYWDDPVFAEKALAARNKSPNNLEIDFDGATPEILRFTGDSSWWRQLPNGKYKNPDFKVTGKNQVIELFGDYWHKDDDPDELISLYKEIGIECLVIWESEWKKNRGSILEQVNQFIGKDENE